MKVKMHNISSQRVWEITLRDWVDIQPALKTENTVTRYVQGSFRVFFKKLSKYLDDSTNALEGS